MYSYTRLYLFLYLDQLLDKYFHRHFTFIIFLLLCFLPFTLSLSFSHPKNLIFIILDVYDHPILTEPFSRLSVPEVIRFNRSEYKDDVGIDEEVQVGPEIMHIYQVYGVIMFVIPGSYFLIHYDS